MTGIAYRQAELGEAADILAVLLEVAPEIPVSVDTLEQEEALYALIRNCARSGESSVAIDDAGRIVGLLVVELSPARRIRKRSDGDFTRLGLGDSGQNGMGDLVEHLTSIGWHDDDREVQSAYIVG